MSELGINIMITLIDAFSCRPVTTGSWLVESE